MATLTLDRLRAGGKSVANNNPNVRSNPYLAVKEISDTYVRKNFENLSDYFASQNQLLNFKFLEIMFTRAETDRRIPHGLPRPPKDLLRTRMTGTGVVTFHRGDFDNQFIYASSTGPARVRLFVGTYFNSPLGDSDEPEDDESWSSSVAASVAATAETPTTTEVALITEEFASGVNGGNPVVSVWTKRYLNTLYNPTGATWLTLSDSRISLNPGKYRIRASSPFMNRDITDNTSRLRLYNVTEGAIEMMGRTQRYSGLSGLDRNDYADLWAVITVATRTIFEIQYYLFDDAGNGAGYGLGIAMNDGVNEIYSIVEIERLGAA